MPPTPTRLGSTKDSVSFQVGLVKSAIASSRPNTQWPLRCAGVHKSRSQASSSGCIGTTSRTSGLSRYMSGMRLSVSSSVTETVWK